MRTHSKDRYCSRVSRHEILRWLAVLGMASERQLMTALDCRTWSRTQSLHDGIRHLLAQGFIRQMTHARQRLFFIGQRELRDVHGTFGLADLTVAVDRSLRSLGYTPRWMNTCAGSAEFARTGLVLFRTPPGSTLSAYILHYDDQRWPLRQTIRRLSPLTRLSFDVRRFYGATQVGVLASFDLWPPAQGERWLSSFVQTMKNERLYAANHIWLLDTPAPYALTAGIWHHCAEAEPTAVLAVNSTPSSLTSMFSA